MVDTAYCSGDVHVVETERYLPGYGNFHMRGRRMAHEAIKRLVGLHEKSQLVFFGGSSAGGIGGMVTIDALR